MGLQERALRMSRDLVRAHLNLCAVLQNLEELVKLDTEMAQLAKAWNVTLQFVVLNGPAAYVEFKNGVCRHGVGRHAAPDIKLFFLSPHHLNSMFDGKGTPIPLKGFSHLGFLKKDFTALTDRLTHYLKPANGKSLTEQERSIATILTLNTAFYAVKELAVLEPTCAKLAAHTPKGALQVEVLPDGPHLHLIFNGANVRVAKGTADKPMAKMAFRSLNVAADLLSGKLDAFQAVAAGDISLRGQLPIIDSVNLMLDRVEGYLA